jgi:hypothetical protein
MDIDHIDMQQQSRRFCRYCKKKGHTRASLTWLRAQSVVAGLLGDVSKAFSVWRREEFPC